MKIFLTFFISICIYTIGLSKSLVGSWQWEGVGKNGQKIQAVAIYSETHVVTTWYDMTGVFKWTEGGNWRLSDNTLSIAFEFHSQDNSMVGKEVTFDIEFDENQFQLKNDLTTWKRTDDGTPGDLAGAWLITGRMRNGQISERKPGPRKTMKILSGTRFQWIAYNTETKSFSGTGGGTYTTAEGKYTENIEFFSKDPNRVGASLEFNYKLLDGKWNHSGKSSKGNDIYEIWSLR
ncbi:MAG: membrane or secreted protein [Cyclobacteriaceae bacterium]